jgi:CBS domain containing-hemolysin-like protein
VEHAGPDLVTFGWRLAVTLVFLLLNGFFVSAEFALVKVRVTRLDAMAAEGIGRASVASHIHARLNHYLSACQLGITISSLVLGWLAEPAVAELLLAGAAGLGLAASAEAAWVHGVALALALSIVTILHMVIGEQAPKILAINRAESISLRVAYPLRGFAVTFGPFIWLVNGLSNALLRALGMSPEEIRESSHTVDELRGVLAASAQAGHITQRQQELAENILGIVGLETRHILLPRIEVRTLSLARSLEENMQTVRESGHSRFPLCERDMDNILGIVHAKDVLGALADGAPVDLKTLARTALFVPDTMPLSRMILTLQRGHSHCAVVLDEHGTTIGLAFLEDALEEIVGPIHDEFDVEERRIQEVSPGVLEVAGSLALPEAAAFLGVAIAGSESDTIGGHVTALLGRLPQEGDELALGAYRVRVLEVARRRVARLRFERRDAATGPPSRSAPDGSPRP